MRRFRRSTCVLETLEQRLLLSVTAQVVNNDLVITGDDNGNNIVITKSRDTYTLAGDVAGTFTCTGQLLVTTGGGVDWVTLDNVTVGRVKALSSVVLNLGNGHSYVSAKGLSCKDFTYTGADGGSTIEIGYSNADSNLIRGNFTVNAGMGDDAVFLKGTRVQGNVNFLPGRGNNQLTLQANGQFLPFVGGVLTYTGGLNDDQCNILSGQVGSIQANLFAGVNSVYLGAVSVGARGKGDVAIAGDAGDDTFTANGASMRNITFAQGGGTNIISFNPGDTRGGRVGSILVTGTGTSDNVAIRGTAVAGNCTATMGDGANSFATGAQGGFATTIGGKLAYTGGSGEDVINLLDGTVIKKGLDLATGGANDTVILDDLTLSGGAGNAVLSFGAGNDYLSASSFSARNVSIDGGEGDNNLNLTRGATQADGAIAGALTITGGAGADEVHLSGTKFAGNVTITGAAGNNRVFVGDTDQPASLARGFAFTGADGNDFLQFSSGSRVTGPLTVDTGAGNDTVYLYNSTLKGDARIAMGAGTNYVVGHALTCGNLAIEAQTGDGQFTLADDGAGNQSLVKGNLSVTSLDGGVGAHMTLTGATVKGNVTLALGNGSNGFDTQAAGSVKAAIRGRITYTGGSGDDAVRLQSVTLAKAITIQAGDGANGLLLNGATVKGNASYTGGAGVDTVFTSGSEGPWSVSGDLSLTTGGGNDWISIQASLLTESVVGKRLLIDAGTGDDIMQVSINVVVQGIASFLYGPGADSLTFGSHSHFRRAVTIDGGIDADTDTYTNNGAIFDAGAPTVTNIP